MTSSPIAIRLYCLLAAIVPAYPQFAGSGSNGSDGALELTTPGEIRFDPSAVKPSMNPAHDGVYHFTSIYIAAGVTVKLSANVLNGPVFWLAQGPVRIDGNIDLSGADGGAPSAQRPNIAGAGGHAGGVQEKPGYGPGAGDLGGAFTGNQFLVPLVGGSGGAGGPDCGGGAGGGALLIASSTSISVNGAITADGGSVRGDCRASGGSGGAIRLIAPVIEGAGDLSAKGGQPGGGDGRIRLEAFTNNFSGATDETPVATGKPFGLFLPPNPPPSVRVVSVNGVAASLKSTEPLVLSQLNLKRPGTIKVGIEARFIPTGTVIELELFSETGPPRVVSTPPLDGTSERSTASAPVTFPAGASSTYVKANWKLSEKK